MRIISISAKKWPVIRLLFGKKLDSFKRNQLQLDIPRPVYQDRNYDKGGRSFYFFDFDDNVAFLSTPIYIFHQKTGERIPLTSGEYAQYHSTIGKSGPYKDYQLKYENTGSFQSFRDRYRPGTRKVLGLKEQFEKDLLKAVRAPEFEWKGPSWNCFYHAVLNRRPTSVITARGHHPDTIKKGIKRLVKMGFLPHEPNYLSLFPVTNQDVQVDLGRPGETNVALLKKMAIQKSVEIAIQEYGEHKPHRFGMSDDDPKNIQLIFEVMLELKKEYPHFSFFVIDTRRGGMKKWEVFLDFLEDDGRIDIRQLELF